MIPIINKRFLLKTYKLNNTLIYYLLFQNIQYDINALLDIQQNRQVL